MSSGQNGAMPINCFALVTYISGELGAFLDELRCDLVPSCMPKAHVTILPPRPLGAPTALAIDELNAEIADLAAFEVEATSVQIFQNTSVIYIDLGNGRDALRDIHEKLNTGHLAFGEPFEYHPHITVAQELRTEQVGELRAEATRRWTEYRGTRRFPVESMTFVQNTSNNRWLDLAHWSLGAVPSVR